MVKKLLRYITPLSATATFLTVSAIIIVVLHKISGEGWDEAWDLVFAIGVFVAAIAIFIVNFLISYIKNKFWWWVLQCLTTSIIASYIVNMALEGWFE